MIAFPGRSVGTLGQTRSWWHGPRCTLHPGSVSAATSSHVSAPALVSIVRAGWCPVPVARWSRYMSDPISRKDRKLTQEPTRTKMQLQISKVTERDCTKRIARVSAATSVRGWVRDTHFSPPPTLAVVATGWLLVGAQSVEPSPTARRQHLR